MQRFIPDGRYLSSLAVAFSATLAACGGGSGDTSPVVDTTQAAASSANDTSTNDAGTVGTGITSSSESAGQDAAAAIDSKPIVVPPADTDTTTVALATSTPMVSTANAPQASADASSSDTTQAMTSGASSSAAVVSPRSGVGLNLSAMNYFSSEVATIDVMKRAGSWLTQCNNTQGCSNFAAGEGTWDTKEEARLNLDANGYPKSLPAADDSTTKYRKVATMISANGTLPAGRYTVVYDGQGTLTYSGSVVKSASLSKPGRDVIDLTGGPSASLWLTITATTPSNYLRNIRVFLPGGACASDLQTYAADASACTGTKGTFVPFEAFPKTNIWNPQFLADVKGFRTLRFMDWGATNSNLLENWSERPLPTDRTWAGPNGAPVEAMLDLANATSSDPWINLPAHVTDDYILQFGRLATQNLSAGLKVNLEYANEPWNYAFKATKWILAQAQTAWPEEVAKGTSIYTLQNNWYARRLVQACGIAKGSSAGASTRFRCVSNTQAAQPSMTEQVLACAVAAKTLGQVCAKSIDVVSIAPYFGYYLGSSTLRSMVSSWYSASDGGLGKVFQELTGHDASGKSVTEPLAAIYTQAPTGAIAQAAVWMVGTKAVAAKYGLPMWAYEGGQHLVPPAGDTDATFANLMIAVNRDARMQGAYDQMMATWQAAGGQVFSYYSHAVAPSKTGSWGLKENMGDNGNAKWKSAVSKRNAACWWSGC